MHLCQVCGRHLACASCRAAAGWFLCLVAVRAFRFELRFCALAVQELIRHSRRATCPRRPSSVRTLSWSSTWPSLFRRDNFRRPRRTYFQRARGDGCLRASYDLRALRLQNRIMSQRIICTLIPYPAQCLNSSPKPKATRDTHIHTDARLPCLLRRAKGPGHAGMLLRSRPRRARGLRRAARAALACAAVRIGPVYRP